MARGPYHRRPQIDRQILPLLQEVPEDQRVGASYALRLDATRCLTTTSASQAGSGLLARRQMMT